MNYKIQQKYHSKYLIHAVACNWLPCHSINSKLVPGGAFKKYSLQLCQGEGGWVMVQVGGRDVTSDKKVKNSSCYCGHLKMRTPV